MTWTKERIAKLCLGSFPSFGARTLRNLWRMFPTADQAWLAKPSELAKAGITANTITHFCDWRNTLDPKKLIEQLEREDIRTVHPEDKEYPRGFKNSNNPPEILFVRGDLKDAPSISIVGTRRMTAYGKQCTSTITRDVAQTGLSIISGLALGVDAHVHQMTLEENGYTIGILGTGVNDASIYPRENYQLAQRILTSGGAIMSEFPPGSDGRREHFPIRNRLIATISLGTLVIEATEGSGSLITAKLALEENREVLAVPGPIWSAQSKGTNQLLKMGAKVCTEALDVLQALALDRPDLIAEARKTLPMDPDEEWLLEFLDEPLHIDDWTSRVQLKASEAMSKLALLELKGYVSRLGGQMWVRRQKHEKPKEIE